MFGRRKAAVDGPVAETAGTGEEVATEDGPEQVRAHGPWDVSEVTLEEGDESRVDLGSLLMRPHPALDLQLQVDEASGEVAAVMLAGEEGAAELRAFAAPRNGDIWPDVRKAVQAEIARMGGTATETEGRWGTEVVVSLAVQLPDGSHAQQISRVIGVSGPRWHLRATLFGRPAVDYREDGDVETAFRDIVVVRGSTPVPPGDPLPLTLPPNAERAEPQPE